MSSNNKCQDIRYMTPCNKSVPLDPCSAPKRYTKSIFAIDSRQRNFELYPSASNYNLALPEKYNNVVSLELKAAMLPRCEYNVNSSNKYIDFNVGDYIHSIPSLPREPIKNADGTLYTTTALTNVPLNISPPSITGSNITQTQATITVNINSSSKVTGYNITNAGGGYSSTLFPSITLGTTTFTAQVGVKYTAELREGQYVIGGNPQTNISVSPFSQQSWVPNNLLNEIESALSYAILKDHEHCYSRQPWTALKATPEDSTTDYPLLFASRLMSQYPTVDTYTGTGSASQTSPQNFETNSCKFNRIYSTNCLIFRSATLPTSPFEDDFVAADVTKHFLYEVLKYDTIPAGGGYILYCKLAGHGTSSSPTTTSAVEPIQVTSGPDSCSYWPGLTSTTAYKLAHWEYLFASGDNNLINSATLLGYNKKNYNQFTENNTIEVTHADATATASVSEKTTLIPKGITYAAENDYYLFGDPEYVNLSFSPSSGGSSLSELNQRVDSQHDSNINRVFACLIFDATLPAVIQDMSSGRSDATLGSYGEDNNTQQSFMNYDSTHGEVKQLTGNSGNQNTSFTQSSGLQRAMRGADFDQKMVVFPHPVSGALYINITFTKFNKLNKRGTTDELYDFHGKEHLLLFEVTREY